MPYATEAQFAALIGEVETSGLVASEADGLPIPGRLAAALDAASADIDAILGARRMAIAGEQPTLLQTACIHIARWHLTGAGSVETDPITRRHRYYTEQLQALASGSAGGAGVAAAEAVVVQAAAPSRISRGCKRCR